MKDNTIPSDLNLFTLYSLSKQAYDDAALATDGVKMVMDVLQAKIDEKAFESVDAILKEVHVNLLHADIIVAFLTVTKSHPELKERADFYEKAFAQVHEIDAGRTDKYLETLK